MTSLAQSLNPISSEAPHFSPKARQNGSHHQPEHVPVVVVGVGGADESSEVSVGSNGTTNNMVVTVTKTSEHDEGWAGRVGAALVGSPSQGVSAVVGWAGERGAALVGSAGGRGAALVKVPALGFGTPERRDTC